MSLRLTIGENGIITNAVKASFYTEMSAINEQKELSKVRNFMEMGGLTPVANNFLSANVPVEHIKEFTNTLKAEIIFARNSFGIDPETGKGDVVTTNQVWRNNLYDCKEIYSDELSLSGLSADLYYISEEASGKKETYIYDSYTDICFKVPDTTIGTRTVHSLEYAQFIIDGMNSTGIAVLKMQASVMDYSGTKCYEPDLNNFGYKTEIVYYSADFTKQKTLNIEEYLEMEQEERNTIEVNGETYTFADYSPDKKIWGNIKTNANGLDAYWVWIPRFAYKLDESVAKKEKSDIIFVNINNKTFDGEELPEGYVVHEAFLPKTGMKGIWFSKYRPTALETLPIDSTEPESPDLSNFSASDVKLVYYTADAKSSIEVDYSENPSQTVVQDGTTYYWYSYEKQLWANIKTTANGLDAYWVWIPRYAYKLESGESSVILIDTDNNPLDMQAYGETLPSSYTVHEVFAENPSLKGIWFSKYRPTATETDVKEKVEAAKPDLSNFSADDTKLIYYTADAKSSIEVDYSANPGQTVVQDGTTYYFYKYESKIWANIKTTGSDLVAYWTWIPRYAYKIESGTTNVILIDENNVPINTSVYGTSLPAGYTVHEAFTQGDGLKGIWFSKYRPSAAE